MATTRLRCKVFHNERTPTGQGAPLTALLGPVTRLRNYTRVHSKEIQDRLFFDTSSRPGNGHAVCSRMSGRHRPPGRIWLTYDLVPSPVIDKRGLVM